MNDGLTEKDNKILLQALEGLAAVKLRSPGATTTEAPPTTPASLQGSPGSQLTPPDKKDIALINDPDLVHPLSGPTASPSEGLLVSEAEKPASTKQHKRYVSRLLVGMVNLSSILTACLSLPQTLKSGLLGPECSVWLETENDFL